MLTSDDIQDLNEVTRLAHFYDDPAPFQLRLAWIKHICRAYSYRTKLIFSSKIITDVYDPDQYVYHKPYGLWYTYGRAWIDFLLSNAYGYHMKWAWSRLREIQAVYKIEPDYSDVLKIRNYNDFSQFTKLYGVKSQGVRYGNSPCLTQSKGFKHRYLINWDLVAKDFHGIQIRYYPVAENDFFWYNAWDVSSGCLWHKNSKKNLKLLVRFY